ncbi:MAG TPA: hypothetical protein VGQ80_01720 [Acidimicrobiia bacterium]|nr:hypothetical protein [Acidimicrobiia bacterium]
MFSVHCPRHGGPVLLGPTDIVSIGPGPQRGFTVAYRCTCGHEGRWSAAGDDAACEPACLGGSR